MSKNLKKHTCSTTRYCILDSKNAKIDSGQETEGAEPVFGKEGDCMKGDLAGAF